MGLDAPTAKDAILAAVSHSFFKLKWVPKAKREYVKDIFVVEIRKIKYKGNKKPERQIESATEDRKEKHKSYFSFFIYFLTVLF